MRVIAGAYKGRRLKSLAGRDVRPTPDRLRESLFGILQPQIEGAQFLDLCAGTGSVGIEALSRGAQRVVFVERSRAALEILKQNVAACGIRGGVEVLRRDVAYALWDLEARGDAFDVVFFDPPYASALYEPVLEELSRASSVLAPGGVLVVRHHAKRTLEPRYGALECVRRVKQGQDILSFYVWRSGRVEPTSRSAEDLMRPPAADDRVERLGQEEGTR